MSGPSDHTLAAEAERARAFQFSQIAAKAPFGELALYRLCPICLKEPGIPRYSATNKDLRSSLIDVDGLSADFLDSFPMIYAHCEACDHLFISPLPPLNRIDLARLVPNRREQILRAFNEQRQNLWMEEPGYIEDKRRSVDFHYRTCNFDVMDHGRAILDIGCGTGVALSLFHERGWTQCYGLEPDLYSIRQIAQRRPFITAFWADIYSSETTRFTNFFDLVMLDNVLEHHTEPHLSIDICARMLAPGGRLWIAVPNSHGGTLEKLGSSYGNMNFGHWSFFSARSLALLLSRQFKTAMLYDSQRQCHLELCELSAQADQLACFTEDWVQALAVLEP